MVLAKARILDTDPDQFNYVGTIVEHSAKIFDLRDQLLYLCLLPSRDRRSAYEKILRQYGGAAEELIGKILEDGTHAIGLMEQALVNDAGAHVNDFHNLMASEGMNALKRGRYISALRMLHLGER